jgi:DNA repair protein RecO (recombination protein O)
MNRNRTYTALILHARPTGESNREISFLTMEEGLLRATVFGGPKSKLRSHTAPYHQGTLWIYRDPVKDYLKVTDFDVLSWRPGLREKYERSMAAALVAETILASHGGGGQWEDALSLAGDTLDALENAGEESSVRLIIQFLWNWADILGFKPDLLRCSSCGKIFSEPGTSSEKGSSPGRKTEILWYSEREGSVICASCAGLSEENRELVPPDMAGEFLPLGPGSRRWLGAAEKLKPAQLIRVTMDKTAEGEARALTGAIMKNALGKGLSIGF